MIINTTVSSNSLLELEETSLLNLVLYYKKKSLLSYIQRFQTDNQKAMNLCTLLKEKDIYTYNHSQRVMNYSLQLAVTYGFTISELKILYYAATLHDIGKLSVPEHILKKPGKLTKDEWMIIYSHPVVSEEIIRLNTSLTDPLPSIRHHHERYDGNGYPDRLKGKSIPLAARIIAVADAFDAITSTRPYNKAVSITVAARTLQEEAGTQFDPSVVEAFIKLLQKP